MFFLLLILCVCPEFINRTKSKAEVQTEKYTDEYFTEITSWKRKDSNRTYMIVYANDTKVKYFICDGASSYGITPLYNTDGTLQIYEEGEE